MDHERDLLFIMIVSGLVLLFFTGCSYGTYNATGSYPNQDNHTTDNCASPKG